MTDAPFSARVRLDVGYDGTGFSGWAVQPGRRTVAGALVDALARLFGEYEYGLTVAGRTDAGVHATGQVCHVDVPPERWAVLGDTFVRRLGGLLPPDVRVFAATRVSADFDARFSALSRTYEYRVTDDPSGGNPLRRYDTLAWPQPLDLAALNAAAEPLTGEHDFAAYCKRKEHATTIRAVSRFAWRRDDDGVYVATIEADAFCQAMVRSLVGALLAVGDGRRTVGWPGSLLTRTERASEVMVVPPHGLTLVHVAYPGEEAYGSRNELTRQRRVSR